MKRLLAVTVVVAGCGIIPPTGGLEAPTGTVTGQLNVVQTVQQGLSAASACGAPSPCPSPTGRGEWAPGGGGEVGSPVPGGSGPLDLPSRTPLVELQRFPEGSSVIPGEVLVRFEEPDVEVSVALGALTLSGYQLEHAGPASRYLHVVRYRHPDGSTPTEAETEGLAALLSGHPGVRFTTVNRWHFPTLTPDDPLFLSQWHYRTLNLPSAWDVMPRTPGVVVAVVDSGVRVHPDLAPHLLPGVDAVSDAINAGDGDARDADPSDP
ncbi:MAG: hypothetical protein L0Y64_00630, partial [Myxococcaceae bacterium]|nr:hypothetical protein [Myxococcaceae bacterium]